MHMAGQRRAAAATRAARRRRRRSERVRRGPGLPRRLPLCAPPRGMPPCAATAPGALARAVTAHWGRRVVTGSLYNHCCAAQRVEWGCARCNLFQGALQHLGWCESRACTCAGCTALRSASLHVRFCSQLLIEHAALLSSAGDVVRAVLLGERMERLQFASFGGTRGAGEMQGHLHVLRTAGGACRLGAHECAAER